jgi:hypothetical protein
MKIFLCYASEDRATAESIAFSLRGRSHQVFFDRDDLPPGASYDEQIERAIKGSDVFVFLISPDSVTRGRYTLTEQKFAREKWLDPNGYVLPVLVRKTPGDQIPPYLKAVTMLEPDGNIAAETSATVDKILSQRNASSGTLKLILMEPEGAITSLPKVIDFEVARKHFDAEAARMGLQSIDWVAATLEEYDNRFESAKNSLIAENRHAELLFLDVPATPLEQYARELRTWYKGILLEAAIARTNQHNAIRAVKLRFRLENNGRVAAEKVEVEIKVTPAELVKHWRPDPTSTYRSKTPIPVPPPALGLPAPKDTKLVRLVWYDLSEYRSQQQAEQKLYYRHSQDVQLFDAVESEGGGKFLRTYGERLQQKRSFGLQPFYVVFGEHPIQDVEVEYKIYAENQPDVTEGKLTVRVREREA